MERSEIAKTLVVTLVLLALGLSPLRPAYADQNDDLKAQIKVLNDRIAQLEQQVEKNNGAMTAQGASPSADGVWDPFTEMQNMRAQMNQMFQNSFDRGFGAGSSAMASPQMDIKESPDHYTITMDLPGMDKDKINVEVKNGMLVVSGESNKQSQVNQNKQGNQVYRQESSSDHFLKAIPLPNGAKPDDIKADYKNGILEIRMGRVAGDKPGNGGKRILVN